MLLFNLSSAQNFFFFFTLFLFHIHIEFVFQSGFQLSFISMSDGEKSEQSGTTIIRFLVEEMDIRLFSKMLLAF